jgi:hypothetical protein
MSNGESTLITLKTTDLTRNGKWEGVITTSLPTSSRGEFSLMATRTISSEGIFTTTSINSWIKFAKVNKGLKSSKVVTVRQPKVIINPRKLARSKDVAQTFKLR